MGRTVYYAVVVRVICLDNNLPRLIRPSGSSCCLGQKVKCPLGCPVVSRIKGHIGSKSAAQGNILKIMPLNYHLRTDQYIGIPF